MELLQKYVLLATKENNSSALSNRSVISSSPTGGKSPTASRCADQGGLFYWCFGIFEPMMFSYLSHFSTASPSATNSILLTCSAKWKLKNDVQKANLVEFLAAKESRCTRSRQRLKLKEEEMFDLSSSCMPII